MECRFRFSGFYSSSVNIDKLNKGKKDKLPSVDSVPGLFERYQKLDIIPTDEAKRGWINTVKVGIMDGSPELILTSDAHGISSLDPHTGKLNWELPVMKYRAVGSPIAASGLIFAACGEGGNGKQMFAVQPPDAARKQAAKVAYNVNAKLPYVVTPVACGKLLFLWTDQGYVSCLDAATGKKLWQQRVEGAYFGSPIRIRDRLYCISREGQVVVIAAADKYRLLGQTRLGEPSQSTPVYRAGCCCCERSRNCWRSERNWTYKE